ncbi:DUF3010 family protein [Balneatrix alpica]|uniref:DUF3010 family protein n=1 Tax=Balneatrix alpica TaxID=75684 RepID=A0ABV5ZCI0_9GAMM|nr:DUF3010 family protein [Balneatrix alpica]
MRVCGVELKGNEAVVAMVALDRGLYHWLPCRTNKFTLRVDNQVDEIRKFQYAFSKLLHDYQIEQVVVLERPHKGRFMGSAMSFKLEAAIQLIKEVPTALISHADVNNFVDEHPLPEVGLKAFQRQAFLSAYAWLGLHKK